jgi:hypothetical protein
MTKICTWIGCDNEKCLHPAIPYKSYCATHYDRMFLILLPEMADYIIEQELNSTNNA